MGNIRTVECSAPLRIDLCGGSLDIPPIPHEMGPTHVVSAAINRRVRGSIYHGGGGFILSYQMPLEIDTGIGLGSSGVMNLVWLSLVTGKHDRAWLANHVFEMEKATGVCGGTQDQYTGAYGGVNLLTFSGDRVWVKPIWDTPDESSSYLTDKYSKEICASRLEEYLVLVDSRITRPPSTMNEQFIARYKNGEMYKELGDLNSLSTHVVAVLRSEFYPALGQAFDEEWELRKVMMPCNTEEIDARIAGIKSVAKCGCKVTGQAGGGGILIALNDPCDRNVVVEHVRQAGMLYIPFKFDFDGLLIKETNNES